MATKRKANPRPRLGTKNPRRKSSATGRAPTKRLVKRRTKNLKKGYFPNPAKKKIEIPGFVVRDEKTKRNIAFFTSKAEAVKYGNFYAAIKRRSVTVRTAVKK